MQQIVLNGGLLILSVILLWKGSGWLVDSAARIGRNFGLSDLVIGLTIVAFGTSAPEFAVTISAALRGQSDISVGNIIGSNIFNLGFILGGCAVVNALKSSAGLVYRDGTMLIVTAVILAFMLQDLRLSRLEGILLMAGLFIYILMLFRSSEGHEEEIPTGKATRKDYFLLTLGIGLVIGGGHLMVVSASEVARFFGVSDWVISVTIVAAGTSSAEFVTSLRAAAMGRHGMSLGNLVGSDLYNLLGVLGLAGTIRVMDIAPESLNSIYMLVGMCVLTVFFMRTGWKVSRWEGLALIAIGLLRWGLDFLG